MDIWKYAEEINFAADYLDPHTNYIYALTEAKEYNYEKIPVYYDEKGNMMQKLIGFVNKNS